jgi:hypothetical protein
MKRNNRFVALRVPGALVDKMSQHFQTNPPVGYTGNTISRQIRLCIAGFLDKVAVEMRRPVFVDKRKEASRSERDREVKCKTPRSRKPLNIPTARKKKSRGMVK